MGTTKEYKGRGIHKINFINSLKSGKLKKMLDLINKDDDLDAQIRNNYLNIYYMGGNIAKINSERSIVFDMYYYYWDIKDIPKKYIMTDEKIKSELKNKKNKLVTKFKNENYKEYFAEAKKVMEKWGVLEKKEKVEQHKLSINNRYENKNSDYTILDLEYQVSERCDFKCKFIPEGKKQPKKPRFDIIAVNREGKLCVIELKKGKGALSGTSGLQEHLDCYEQSINYNHKPFVDEMKNLLKQKQDFGLINKYLEIKINKPEFMFAYAFDKKSPEKEQKDYFMSKYKDLSKSGIHIIWIKEKELILKD